MNALIPNKDTLLVLAETQKKILESYNSSFAPDNIISPIYPLWAFSKESFEKEIVSCTIEEAKNKENEYFFPVEITFIDGKKKDLRIVFAKIITENKKSGFDFSEKEIKHRFPIKERVFRTGEVVIDNNSWELFDDKWHKCQKIL